MLGGEEARMAADLISFAKKLDQLVVDLRRVFHMFPETSWGETGTFDRIRRWFDEREAGINLLLKNRGKNMSICLHEGRGGIWYDLIVDLKLPFVIFRADVDALKIQEEGNATYCSQNPGVMHACGHDCHIAMLMCGMAAILDSILHSGLRPKSNIRFVFQRAEEDYTAEQGSGGKVLVLQGGVCDNVAAAIGLHVCSERDDGFWTRSGTLFVNSDRVGLTIRTAGGHAGMPDRAVNALDLMDDLILEIRHWPQRLVSYDNGPVVISHTVCHAGGDETSANIVPKEATRWWSVRTGTSSARDQILDAFRDLALRMRRQGISPDLEIIEGHPAVVLNPGLVKKTALLLGPEAYTDHPIVPGGEDFAHYAMKVPSVFYLLGTGGKRGITDIPHHRSTFDVDESQLWKGVWFWLKMAFELEL